MGTCYDAAWRVGGTVILRLSTEQEQQRVAVGLGNVQFISVREVSSDAATMLLLHLLLMVLCIANLLIKN